MALRHVRESLHEFIGHERQRRPFAQPCCLVYHLFGHRLLYKQAPLLFEPVAHVEGFVLVVPSLVDVHAYRSVGHLAYNLYGLAVAVKSHLDLEHLVWLSLIDLDTHYFGCVDAYGI